MRTRFAPSPTGPLHLGHAYAAIMAHDVARNQGGTFLLRIEDIDRARSKSEWEAQIFDDLGWLGLSWAEPVLRQSDRMQAYRDALAQLWDMDCLYPCTCNRRDILAAASAPHEGEPPMGPDGVIYPGTCRHKPRPDHLPGPDDGVALRLDMARALSIIARKSPDIPSFQEVGAGPEGESGHISVYPDALLSGVGDIVLARRDMGSSYHLSVVVDDAAQGVTLVTRGNDLFDATRIHIVLQALLGLSQPRYLHHRLIRDGEGRRLAKRDDAHALSLYRAAGKTPADIREMLGLQSTG